MKNIFASVLIMMACWSCTESGEKTEQRVFVVNLVNDTAKIRQYLEYHRNIWPEVEAGFRKAGYREISLYRFLNLLVMTLEVPAGSDLNAMGKLAESTDPKCAEWNKLMNNFQQGVDGTTSGQTWVEVERFYHFKQSD